MWLEHSKSQPSDDKLFPKGAWSLSRDLFNFYVPILHRFEILPLISLNLKRSRDPEHIPFGESTIIDALLLLCINQHTKFKVPSCTDSKEMIGVYI